MALQTYSGLTAEQKTFYERVLLERLTPNLLYQKYGQAKPMPKNEGDTVCFRRFEGFDAALTPLTEGVAPSGQSLSIKTITATVEQYGDFVEISDKLDMAGIDPVLTEVAKMFGEQAGDTIDKVVRNPGGEGATAHQPSPLPEGVSNAAVGDASALGAAVSSTPEPETWAAMLVVLAVLGAQMARRRARGNFTA